LIPSGSLILSSSLRSNIRIRRVTLHSIDWEIQVNFIRKKCENYTNSQAGRFIDWMNVHASHAYVSDEALICIYKRNYIFYYSIFLSSRITRTATKIVKYLQLHKKQKSRRTILLDFI
jgi:hypothetical protein